MSLIHTPICNFGEKANDFTLSSTDEKKVSLKDIRGSNGTLIMFICNHCPYVKSVITSIVNDAKYLETFGIKSVAIMSNDTKENPEDSFENMKTFAKKNNFSFPYLYDEDQTVAKNYGAVCTPDFFGYNKNLELQYRGRIYAARPTELSSAMQNISKTGKGPEVQFPSMGCNIKWIDNEK